MNDKMLQELERAATSMLTDDEICVSLGISTKELQANYSVVETARIRLKQRLNSKLLSDTANGDNKVAAVIQQIPRNTQKKKSRGGAQPGAGRKPGTSNKISGATILASVEKYSGERFEDLLAQGYVESIEANDKATRLQYEKMFLNKVVADRAEIDHTTGGERIQAAFAFVAAELPDYAKK